MREARQTVLAYGTTGVRGAPVASRLLDAGYRLRVLVRDAANATAWAAAGAEVFEGDLAEPESLARASAGADAVYLHMPLVYDRPRAAAFVRNVLAAAEAGGVQRIVFQGNARFPAEPTEVVGFEIDRDAVTAVHASALASVVLRPTVYMDNVAGPWTAPAIGGEGVVAYPIPAEARTAFASADDAAALAVAAIGRADLDGATFDLAGPEVLTGNDVAARFAAALGRAVRYQAIPLDRFEAGLRSAVGEAAAWEIVAMYRWDAERSDGGRNEVDSVPSLAALPTRLTSFAEWIGGRAEFAAPTRPEPEPVLR